MKIKKKIFLALALFGTMLLGGCGASQKEVASLMEKGRAEFDAGNYMNCVTSYKEALDISDNPKEIYRELGIAYLEMEKYPQAIEAFTESLHAGNGFIKPVDYDINLYLGKAYTKSGMYEKAVEVYTGILDMKPKMLDAYYERAIANLYLGNKPGAMDDFAKVTSDDAKNIDKYLNIYFAILDAGFETDAREYLQETLDNAPGSTSDYDKGRMCYYLNDFSNARVYLEKAKDMSKPDTILMLGKTYEAINDYSYASSLYNEYLSEKGNNAGVYSQLGKCRMYMKDYEAALMAYSSGLKLDDPNWNQVLLYNEAVTYEYMLDFKTAYTKMKEYLDKYPKDENAQRELIFLATRY